MGMFNYTSTFRQGSDLPLTLQYLSDPESLTGTELCRFLKISRNYHLQSFQAAHEMRRYELEDYLFYFPIQDKLSKAAKESDHESELTQL